MSDSNNINQAYFNKIAAEYDQRYEKTLGQLEQELRLNKDFIGVKPGGRMLDYACGTGLLSRALGSELSQCVGIDISESMVEYYNAKSQAQGLYPDRRQAHIGNLLLASLEPPSEFSSPVFSSFDLAGVGAGFHHFDDRNLAATRLAERLAPGGVLFILDFMTHAVDPDSASHGVTVPGGFDEATVREIFEGAGVGGGFAFKEMDAEIVFPQHNRDHDSSHGHGGGLGRRMFIARGTKA